MRRDTLCSQAAMSLLQAYVAVETFKGLIDCQIKASTGLVSCSGDVHRWVLQENERTLRSDRLRFVFRVFNTIKGGLSQIDIISR